MLAIGGHRCGDRDQGVGGDRGDHLDGTARIELGGKLREKIDREVVGDLDGTVGIE